MYDWMADREEIVSRDPYLLSLINVLRVTPRWRSERAPALGAGGHGLDSWRGHTKYFKMVVIADLLGAQGCRFSVTTGWLVSG